MCGLVIMSKGVRSLVRSLLDLVLMGALYCSELGKQTRYSYIRPAALKTSNVGGSLLLLYSYAFSSYRGRVSIERFTFHTRREL